VAAGLARSPTHSVVIRLCAKWNPGHRRSSPDKLGCVRAEVLFVDDARLVDNESHHTRGAVLRWISDESKSCGHLSADHIILGSARCMRSLAREDPEKIAIERNVSSNLAFWEILAGVSDQRIDWAFELIFRPLPIQAVIPATSLTNFFAYSPAKPLGALA